MKTLHTASENLTRTDLCDSCGAMRLKVVQLPSGGLIQFCNHHFQKNEDALLLAGAAVVLDVKIAEKRPAESVS